MRSAKPDSYNPVLLCSAFSIATAILCLSKGTFVPSRLMTCNISEPPRFPYSELINVITYKKYGKNHTQSILFTTKNTKFNRLFRISNRFHSILYIVFYCNKKYNIM